MARNNELVLADKYSAGSGIPAEFYFALFRAGIPTDADGLYRTNSETVKKIWEKAVEENLIEASLKPTIDQNIAKFKENGSTHLLENAKPIGVSSLKELLGISLSDRSMQREFVQLYFNHVGDMSGFWANAKTKIGKDTADKLQLDGKLGYFNYMVSMLKISYPTSVVAEMVNNNDVFYAVLCKRREIKGGS